MSDYETVLYSHSDGVAEVTINRPAAMNSFNVAARRDLAAALQKASTDDSVRVVVLAATGRGFGAGADLKEGLSPSTRDQVNYEYRPIFEAIVAMPKPVISVIHGAAAGISLSMAMACDLTVMADDAFLLAPFTTIGLVPDGGLTFAYARQLGYKRAFQVLAEAERVPADQALAWGLVNKIVPADQVLDEALVWAAALARRAPLALARTKKLLRLAMQADFDTVYRAEADAQQACVESDDSREGTSAFMEKRAPQFNGS